MVGYAFAAQYPDRVTRFALMDAPLPGIRTVGGGNTEKSPLLWHFRFGGPDMERLVAGRERIYLDRFWNEFSADPKSFGEAAREHYAKLYAQSGAMHAGFNQFAAFDQDAIDNRVFLAERKADHASVGGGRREVLRTDDGGCHARRRDKREGGGHCWLGALAYGGATGDQPPLTGPFRMLVHGWRLG